tara:strand:- start:566 stop:763 length:198 start_codon:yes stop_codon:yes gene_type:complete
MKLLRKILIRSGIWGYFYPPYDFVGVKVHRDWPWKKKPLTADEIVSVQPMSEPSAFVFYYEESEE